MGWTRRRWAVALVGVLLVAGGAAAGYRYWPRPAANQLILFGNVDIRQVDLAFDNAGRIQELHKEEGDRVKAGDVLARLEPETYTDLVALAQARVDAQRAAVERLVTGSRPEEIARERAQVEADRAAVVDAELVLKRRGQLVEGGNVSRQLYDDAKANFDSSRARLDVASQVLRLTELGPRHEDIDEGKAQLRADEAVLSLAKRRLAEVELKAPADGIVMSRIVEPGAMVTSANPVYTLSLTGKVWVRTYVGEPDLGRIRPGLVVQISSDTDPARTYEGWIGFISPTAEFTPKTVETTELRTQLVYRLRVFVRDPDDRLRQGMPVTVRVPLGS